MGTAGYEFGALPARVHPQEPFTELRTNGSPGSICGMTAGGEIRCWGANPALGNPNGVTLCGGRTTVESECRPAPRLVVR